jgi:signal transduction histidine kinase
MSRARAGPRATIARRLTLAYASLIFAAIAITLGFVYVSTSLWLDRRVAESLSREFQSLVEHDSAMGPGSLSDEITRRLDRPERDGRVYIYTESRFERIVGNVQSWPEGLEVGPDRDRRSLIVTSAEGSVTRRVAFESGTLPDGRHLLVGRDVTDEEQLMRVVAVAMSSGLAFAVLIGIAGGLSMSRRLLARVTRMNETVLDIIGGRSDRRVPHDEEGNEFDVLARHFNHLLDENDRLVSRMREVTDDVAHDLRTPLARMRVRIDAALATDHDEQVERETLGILAEDIERVLETFSDLIEIAKIESSSIRAQMDDVSLDDLVRDVVELYRPLAEDAGANLVEDTGEQVHVRGNRHLLSRALTNLIDNAIKYAPNAGDIEVAARRVGDRAELRVTDHGPGIPERQRVHVLERFVRLDASRGRPGSGLGLSFVAAVASHHGARLELTDAGPGLCVRILFPPD